MNKKLVSIQGFLPITEYMELARISRRKKESIKDIVTNATKLYILKQKEGETNDNYGS